MIELSVIVWFYIAFFAYVGWTRGWTKEIISMSGIVLGLFAMFEFDTLIRFTLLGDLPLDQKFYLQSVLFLLIVFFAYQTRALVGTDAERARSRSRTGRDPLQSKVLGLIVGGINGYLISGTIWYFLDINRVNGAYPLDPYVIAPPEGSLSVQALDNLPLYVLTQNGQNGDLLSLAVVGLFILVLVLI